MHRWTKEYSKGLDNYIHITKRKKESHGFLAMRFFYFSGFQLSYTVILGSYSSVLFVRTRDTEKQEWVEM
ncbi:hypothetical protein Ccrd_006533 [Cynara cardunculus var. scolymus]|uniref:Uncharacterized protein n=1 Tax=Cynara cardunculus var. scolymus TaxID=59895 RepID=A0A103XIR6_CYNCS|nr:hypothetical protein Ccrd_006533 [Cynara cardunculus var. scolymus]